MKRKIPSPCRDSNHRSSSPYPSAIPLNYPVHRKLVVKPEGMRTFRRPKCRWEESVIIDLRGMWAEFIWLRKETNSGERIDTK
jgi:hypothetical protein